MIVDPHHPGKQKAQMAGIAGSILVEFTSSAGKELAPLHPTYIQGPLVTLVLRVPRKGMDRYQVKG